jgi:2-iminobutanoate/2-iminopropanoate deaminase
MNRSIMKFALLGFVIVAAAVFIIAGPSGGSEKRAFNPPGAPADLPFSNGLLVGNTLYLAGQQGLVNGKVVPGGIGPETKAALEIIQSILKQAGFQMTDVVTVTVYLSDVKDFAEMTRVYKTMFPQPRPARATVQVAGLVNNARVEISAIAVKQH